MTMDDSDKDMGGDKNAYLVHAEDILKVVNELFVAGAEAVSVNEQRIVAQSGITCAGSVITVNGVRVAAPFEIKAIGDASVLQAALRFPGGVVDTLSPWGIVIDIREEASVTVPAYTGFSIKCLARLRLKILRFIESIILIKYKSNTHEGIFDNEYR